MDLDIDSSTRKSLRRHFSNDRALILEYDLDLNVFSFYFLFTLIFFNFQSKSVKMLKTKTAPEYVTFVESLILIEADKIDIYFAVVGSGGLWDGEQFTFCE